MNKTLTISLVAALAVVGGGSYMLINSEKNLSEYVPEPVAALIGDYLPDNFRAEKPSSVSVSTEEKLVDEVPLVQEVEVPSNRVQQTVEQVTPQLEAATQGVDQVVEEAQAVVDINMPKEIQQNVSEQSDESVVDIAMQEIQKDLNGTSSSDNATSNDPNVKIIEKKIVAVSTKISKLDMENKELKEKFQNILRKNRDLAKQLQEIDKQLMHSN